MSGPAQIDILLRLVPDHPTRVLEALTTTPLLASHRDTHGYSLLHAAASYGHIELLQALVQQYGVSPDIPDEDGETPLFYAESLDVVLCLVNELHARPDWRSDGEEGCTAAEKFLAEGEGPWVEPAVEFLGSKVAAASGAAHPPPRTDPAAASVDAVLDTHPAPPPESLQVKVGTMTEPALGSEPDPEFRRKIEELAARGDFEGQEAQGELRALITEVVTGMREDEEQDGDARETQRRRVG